MTREGNERVGLAVSSPYYGAQACGATVLDAAQPSEFRETALRALAVRWPDALPPVVAELLSREADEPRVLLCALGHAYQMQLPEADAHAAVAAKLAAGSSWRAEQVAQITIDTCDDATLLGACLVSPDLDEQVLAYAIAFRICAGYPRNMIDMYMRAQNAGMVLRGLDPDVAMRALGSAEAYHADSGEQAGFVRRARRYVMATHDIDALIGELRDEELLLAEVNDAARALVEAASEESLRMAVDLLRTEQDPQRRSFVEFAITDLCDGVALRWHARPMPDWARGMPLAQARATLLSLLQEAARDPACRWSQQIAALAEHVRGCPAEGTAPERDEVRAAAPAGGAID